MRYWIGSLAILMSIAGGVPAMAKSTSAILAISWQPAFCEGNGSKAECSSQTKDRFDASHFALHGLWPVKDEYCGVSADLQAQDKSGNWTALPALDLSDDLKNSLAEVMPGTQSGLDRHEWIKHGTCTRFTPQNYYQTAVDLLQQVNGSAVQKVFANNIGKELTAVEIGKAFDDAFGKGASKRIKISCVSDGNRQLIDEITIGLSDQYAPGIAMETLIDGAGSTDIGCDGGIVDAVGNQ
ncbi:ribonuclease [Martelella alba]|uniref:Ribonuclease n=1 Tax=Martelella alba TaxID=2590451 RepID=A0A506UAX0_9HYPH|nr:ribonuclease [Martelella alba]TPW29749.1 ribonuclease [Martelella alba]